MQERPFRPDEENELAALDSEIMEDLNSRTFEEEFVDDVTTFHKAESAIARVRVILEMHKRFLDPDVSEPRKRALSGFIEGAMQELTAEEMKLLQGEEGV